MVTATNPLPRSASLSVAPPGAPRIVMFKVQVVLLVFQVFRLLIWIFIVILLLPPTTEEVGWPG